MVPKINQPRTLTADGEVQVIPAKDLPLEPFRLPPLNLILFPHRRFIRERSRITIPVARARLLPPRLHGAIPRRARRAHNSASRARAASELKLPSTSTTSCGDLQAHGNTELDRDTPGYPRQTSTSQELAADFDALGQWTTVDQSGNVRLREADRSAQAAREHVDHATNIVTLTGSAEAADATTHTTADTISFNQGTSEMRAEGHVLTTYRNVSANGASGSCRDICGGIQPPRPLQPRAWARL